MEGNKEKNKYLKGLNSIYIGNIDKEIEPSNYNYKFISNKRNEDNNVDEAKDKIDYYVYITKQDEKEDKKFINHKTNRINSIGNRYFSPKKSAIFNNNNIECFNCGRQGHYSKCCPYANKSNLIPKKINDEYKKKSSNNKTYKEDETNNIKININNNNDSQIKDDTVNNTNKEIICKKCQNVGHSEEDCLIIPDKIDINSLKNERCFFCKSKGHCICNIIKNEITFNHYDPNDVSFSSSDINNYISDTDIDNDNFSFIPSNKKIDSSSVKEFFKDFINKNKSKVILKNNEINPNFLKQKKIKRKKYLSIPMNNTIYCPHCGGQHSLNECNNTFSNYNERKYQGNSYFNYVIYGNNTYNMYKRLFKNVNYLEDQNYHSQNPLKFGPVYKEKMEINHHNLDNNYYEDYNSSDESFVESFQKKKNKVNKNKN